MTDDSDRNAALWAVGALTPSEYAAMRQELAQDPPLRRRATAWERDLSGLAGLLPPAAPPEGLLAAIESRIDAAIPIGATQRRGAGDWIAIGPGIRIKILHRNFEKQHQTLLLQADAGAVHPAHDHAFDEEIYVISGDLTIEGQQLGPGDFHFSPKGSHHPVETTVGGCECLIIVGF